MPDSPSILTLLLKAIFTGFGFVIPILALVKTSSLKAIEFKNLFVLTAVQVVRIAGILYFILSLTGSGLHRTVGHGLNGAYWLYVLFVPFICLMLSQLFWIKIFYTKKTTLIILSILLLIVPSEFFFVIWHWLYQGHVPSILMLLTATPFTEFITRFALNIVVFVFIMFTILLMGRFKKGKG